MKTKILVIFSISLLLMMGLSFMYLIEPVKGSEDIEVGEIDSSNTRSYDDHDAISELKIPITSHDVAEASFQTGTDIEKGDIELLEDGNTRSLEDQSDGNVIEFEVSDDDIIITFSETTRTDVFIEIKDTDGNSHTAIIEDVPFIHNLYWINYRNKPYLGEGYLNLEDGQRQFDGFETYYWIGEEENDLSLWDGDPDDKSNKIYDAGEKSTWEWYDTWRIILFEDEGCPAYNDMLNWISDNTNYDDDEIGMVPYETRRVKGDAVSLEYLKEHAGEDDPLEMITTMWYGAYGYAENHGSTDFWQGEDFLFQARGDIDHRDDIDEDNDLTEAGMGVIGHFTEYRCFDWYEEDPEHIWTVVPEYESGTFIDPWPFDFEVDSVLDSILENMMMIVFLGGGLIVFLSAGDDEYMMIIGLILIGSGIYFWMF